VRVRHGFVYLVAILDWYSRYVLAWDLSVTVDGQFCLDALETALGLSTPEIFNTDQGAQFTATPFPDRIQAAGTQISMDGRGRALDNVFVERLWRSVKYEEVYLKDYSSVLDARVQLGRYFRFYNHERPHQASPIGHRRPSMRRRRSRKCHGEAVRRRRDRLVSDSRPRSINSDRVGGARNDDRQAGRVQHPPDVGRDHVVRRRRRRGNNVSMETTKRFPQRWKSDHRRRIVSAAAQALADQGAQGRM
jgi:hypothetical protein